MLLHGLKQRGLCLGRSSVDLIRQQHLRKDRTLVEDQIAVPGFSILLNDVRTGDVGRHQVGSKLDAMKRKTHRFRQGFHHECLSQPRDTFQQTVSTCQNRDQQLFDDIFLSDNNASHLFTDSSTRFHKPRRALLMVNWNCLSLWRHNLIL